MVLRVHVHMYAKVKAWQRICGGEGVIVADTWGIAHRALDYGCVKMVLSGQRKEVVSSE